MGSSLAQPGQQQQSQDEQLGIPGILPVVALLPGIEAVPVMPNVEYAALVGGYRMPAVGKVGYVKYATNCPASYAGYPH